MLSMKVTAPMAPTKSATSSRCWLSSVRCRHFEHGLAVGCIRNDPVATFQRRSERELEQMRKEVELLAVEKGYEDAALSPFSTRKGA
jgi:hypothetical protein